MNSAFLLCKVTDSLLWRKFYYTYISDILVAWKIDMYWNVA